MKLFYVILGATPKGRNTEQHDVFFGIAEDIKDLVPEMLDFWKEAEGKIHIDGYQEVQFVDGYQIKISENKEDKGTQNLFFINLGGYKKGFFYEFHEQLLMVDESMANVIKRVKQTEFYQTMGFENAVSHVDDKHGVDIDDIYQVNDLLSAKAKEKYSITLEKMEGQTPENFMKVGYIKLSSL